MECTKVTDEGTECKKTTLKTQQGFHSQYFVNCALLWSQSSTWKLQNHAKFNFQTMMAKKLVLRASSSRWTKSAGCWFQEDWFFFSSSFFKATQDYSKCVGLSACVESFSPECMQVKERKGSDNPRATVHPGRKPEIRLIHIQSQSRRELAET